MKKLSAILVIISLLVSTFDIVDTSDIMIGNHVTFSSTNNLDQDTDDNIDVEAVPSYNLLIFNLVESQQDNFPVKKIDKYPPSENQRITQDFTQKNKKPPIA